MQLLIWLALGLPLFTGLLSLPLRSPAGLRLVNLAGGAATTCVLLVLIGRVISGGAMQSGIFFVDHLSGVLLLVVGLLTFTATLFSLSYMEREVADGHVAARNLPWYYALLNLFTFAMVLVLVVDNLGVMWVAVEATTLASALLVGIYLNKTSLEAAWKYVIICSVGICLALVGTMLLYYAQVTAVGPDQGLSMTHLVAVASQLDPAIVKLAIIFILIGYGTKAGLAPMHTWLPDAHSQAPSPVSGLLSGALLSCAMYALLRNMTIAQGAVGSFANQTLLVLGVISIAIAIPFVLRQHDVKRLLAYSSVEHMGILAVGFGLGTQLAVYAALLHIVNHAVTKSALFYTVGVLSQEYDTKQIAQIRGLARVAPGLATALMVGLLGITGTPPFSIFISKITVVWAMFQSHMGVLATLVLLLLVGAFAGLMYYGLRMIGGPAPEGRRPVRAPASARVAIGLSLALVVVGGLYLPPALTGMLTRAAEIVLGG